MSPKKITIEDLGMTPEEMEILIAGARAILPAADPQEDETIPSPLTSEGKTGP